jgi:amidase
MSDWQSLATQKRNAISALIPEEWRLPSIPTAEQQRNVTGEYIQQFLTEREVEITETDAVGILEKTKKGEWRAEEVARAFCRRAGVAHQLVC